jgi:polar amino acid transport system permease protein
VTPIVDVDFAIQILPALWTGLLRTLVATFFGSVLALLLGFLLFLAISARHRGVQRGSRFLLGFVRSTPLLVQLYCAYFILPQIGVDLSPMAAGSLVLGMHYACFAAEVFRAGRAAVPPGQVEISTALGLRRTQVMRLVIIPQMLPVVLPGLGNTLIALFKETPSLSAITVAELLFTARIVGAENFRYLEPMALCGLIYLTLSLVFAGGVGLLESRLRWAVPHRNAAR